MAENQFRLLTKKRFLPLFVTQALGALNDNFFKNALVILILYKIAEPAGLNGQVLVTLAAGIFILPFFLFSATAGQLADKFDKSRLIRWIKGGEVAIMALGAVALNVGDVVLMIAVLFMMGTQSSFFGPVKYSILPDHLKDKELVGGNAVIEAGTFLSILVGTIGGGLFVLQEHGIEFVSAGIVGLAALGFLSSLWVPSAPPAAPDLKVGINILSKTTRLLANAAENRSIFLSILGISWFWLVGATFLSQFPAFSKDVIGGDETVVTLLLTVFSIGIGVGSLLCNRLLNGEVSAKYVPLAALGMSAFIIDLYFASMSLPGRTDQFTTAMTFVTQASGWRVLGDLIGISLCGGLFIVPLYAILQTRSDGKSRSQTIAANNVVNAAFMVMGAIAAAALLSMGFSVPEVLLLVGILNTFVAVYICGLLPEVLVKSMIKGALKLFYRVEVKGLEKVTQTGKRAVIVVNHVSFLDAVILAVYLPVKPMFAINTQTAQAWWVRPFLKLVDAFPVDPTNPMATKSLIMAVRQDKHCVIFPEGRITVTGALMKVYEGPGMIADKADAVLIPIRIDGAQYTPFSRLKGKLRRRWFPKITVTVLDPQRFDIPAREVGRARRRLAGVKLYDVMTNMIFETCRRDQSLFDALLDAKVIHGGKHKIAEDIERKPIDYNRLLLGSMILGRKLSKLTRRHENVGVMLPNSVGAVVTFFGLQAFGRVPAMLNFSTGVKNMQTAIAAADIKTVLTSRRFVRLAKLEETVSKLSERSTVVYLEDLRKEIRFTDKILGALSKPFARLIHRRLNVKPDDPAVVLFTSGSEGTPKGVVLSHANLLANRNQLAACVDFSATDVVFNALPIFHSFGLTGGALLPLLSGTKTFLYPSPLHYRVVPALVYDTDATILFGTDTFLTGYARVAHPYDFYSVRYVFAGAEKVKEETRRTWSEKFGIRILEGYGATETAPVMAANTPMHFKAGSVGRFVPGISYSLQDVPGIDDGGRLVVRGPNVMLGYLRAENPGVLERTDPGGYDTGDIVDVDQAGFVTIKGRAKRFAKIAGEMVSLSAVEANAAAIWPDSMHAVVSMPDSRKGEQLVLATNHKAADRADLLRFAKSEGIAELMVPKDIRIVDTIPILGTGKVDYAGVQALVDGEAR